MEPAIGLGPSSGCTLLKAQAASSPTPKSGSNRLTPIVRRKVGEVNQQI